MTREDGDALALELAKLAGLDASRMLEGQLVEAAE